MKKSAVRVAAALSIVLLCAGVVSGRQLFALSADSMAIAYTVQGSGDPAIVFVHCWCCDKSYWNDQVPYFEKTHTVVAIDLAGHGDSGIGRADYTLASFAADVAAVVKALDLKKVVLVGHSMGGPVCLESVRLLGDRVVGVIGVDTFQDFGQTIPEEQQRQYLASFQTDFPAVTDRFVRGMFPANADSAFVARIAGDMASAPAEVGVSAMKNMLRYDPAPTVREIRVPIRSINADLWPTNVEGNRTLAPSYDMKLMQGRGHFVQIEDPATFNRLLEDTIAGIMKSE